MTTLSPDKHAKPLAFFLRTNHREIGWIVLISACYCLAMTSMLGAAYYAGYVVDLLTLPSRGAIEDSLIKIIGFVIGYELLFRIGHFFEVFMESRIRANVKRELFDYVTSLSYAYFTDRFSGQIAHKISITADALERMIGYATNMFVEDGVSILVSAGMLMSIHPYLGLYMLIWGGLFCCGIVPYAKYMNVSANNYAEAESRTTGVFVDIFTNIATVKVFGKKSEHERVYAQIDAEKGAYRRLGFWNVLSNNYIGISIILLVGGFVAISSSLYIDGLITLGAIVFVVGAVLRTLSITWELGQGVISFIRERGECQQNLKDLVVSPAITDGVGPVPVREDQTRIEYRNVTFGYTPERPVLNNLSLTVIPGEKVGIVGLSGAGKTTLASLLLRFFDVQEGGVYMNGARITDLSQEYLRSHISYISQDPSLFHMTIAENIAYGAVKAAREEVQKAAHLAYADEFIELLPHKYDSVVGERGVKLSGGQRQRIAIARAILADRPLFLLDEATSALDSDSEQKIQKGLASLMEGKTVIAIAHRLSTLSHMDRIVFMEDGKIVENGTHDELLTLEGKYASLWRMQAGGFLPDSL